MRLPTVLRFSAFPEAVLNTMLRVALSKAPRTAVTQHVRAFATPASGLSSNTAPGPFATDSAPSQLPVRQTRHDEIVNNYWDKTPKSKNTNSARDTEDKPSFRKGVMQNLFF